MITLAHHVLELGHVAYVLEERHPVCAVIGHGEAHDRIPRVHLRMPRLGEIDHPCVVLRDDGGGGEVEQQAGVVGEEVVVVSVRERNSLHSKALHPIAVLDPVV
jgi:hypothetical protein